MTDDFQSLLLTELFVPNCRVNVKGDHFFADKKLYTNMYGITFFTGAESFTENPHVSSVCKNLPGILDEYFEEAHSDYELPEAQLQQRVTSLVNERFVKEKASSSDRMRWKTECSFLANISEKADGTYVLSYGTVLPTTLCLSDGDSLSAILPFSPIPSFSLIGEKRTFQTVDFPIPAEQPFLPPEEITVDFTVYAKKFSYYFHNALFGKIELEYSVDVGVTRCENSKMTFEITPYYDSDDDC